MSHMTSPDTDPHVDEILDERWIEDHDHLPAFNRHDEEFARDVLLSAGDHVTVTDAQSSFDRVMRWIGKEDDAFPF
jgi:hypothetical protein